MPPRFRGPSGWVGIIAQEQSRYTDFWRSMLGLELPPGWEIRVIYGYDTIFSRNKMVKEFLEAERADGGAYDYLVFMDDDHLVPKDLVRHLLSHEREFVGPLCLRRYPDFWPTAHVDGKPLRWEGEGGLLEVDSTGMPGALIHRSVFETTRMEYEMQERDKKTGDYNGTTRQLPYWFRHGGKYPDRIAEDTDFCERVRKAGFSIWLDLDAWLGHYTQAAVLPHNGRAMFAFGPRLEYIVEGDFRYSKGDPTFKIPVIKEVV